jgi:hypothetical protein
LEPGDPEGAAPAARETLEEVGIALGAPIGRLDDLTNARMRERVPGVRPITVTPFVYVVDTRPLVTHNEEVASTVWIPFPHILHPASSSAYRMDAPRFKGTFPAFAYQRYQVWGLTYRIVETFAALFGLDLPASRALGEQRRRSQG